MRDKIMLSKKLLENIFSFAPLWIYGIFFLGLIPGFLVWIVTGNALAAKTVLRFTLSGSALLLFTALSILLFLSPFWPFSDGSKWAQWEFAAAGSLTFGVGIFFVLLILQDNILLAARLGTGGFALGLWAGRTIQRNVVLNGGEKKDESQQDN